MAGLSGVGGRVSVSRMGCQTVARLMLITILNFEKVGMMAVVTTNFE
jgi:hypothetical protein